MRKVILTSFILAAFLICATSLFSQKIKESPNILIRGNNLARFGQNFLLYCILNHNEHDNIYVTVTVLDSNNNMVFGLIPHWSENLIVDSLQLKSEVPFILNKGRSIFSFEFISQFETSDYTVRVVAFSKSDSDPNTINWIDSTDYIVKTSYQFLPEIKVHQSIYADVGVFYFGDLNEEVTTTFKDAIENYTNIDANIKSVEIYGINGTSDTVFTLVSPKTDSAFVIPAWQKIPLIIRFKPDKLQRDAFSAIVFVNSENSIGQLEIFTIDGYITTFNPSVNEKYTSFKVSPNPVLSTAKITIPTLEDIGTNQELEIIIHDLEGNVIFSKNVIPSTIEQNITFIPKNTGTFSVTLRNKDQNLRTKLFQVLK